MLPIAHTFKRIAQSALLASSLMFAAGSAQATLLVEDDPAQGPGAFYFGAQSVNVNYNGSNHWFSAGAFGLLIDGESTITYCVDLDQFLSLPRSL